MPSTQIASYRHLRKILDMAINDSHALYSGPAGQRYLHIKASRYIQHLQEMGVAGKMEKVGAGSYEKGSAGRVNVYPINVKRAEECIRILQDVKARDKYTMGDSLPVGTAVFNKKRSI